MSNPSSTDAGTARAGADHLPVQAVILAGGAGTRLWPLSREQYPKQLIGLLGDDSLLQSTARRLDGLASHHPVSPHTIVVCGEEHRFNVAEQLRQSGVRARIILEPAGRNTAPALTLAALSLVEGGHDAIMVVMPSDHAVTDEAVFRARVADAVRCAGDGNIVTLGIVPSRAETGYGYLRVGEELGERNTHRLDRFVEKPSRELAQRYLDSGEYLWNSGLFVLQASVWLRAIAQFEPLIHAACVDAYNAKSRDVDFLRVDAALFVSCPSQSIDFAVMERITDPGSGYQVAVVPLDAGWSDVGAWDAVWDVLPKDAAGNVTRGRVMLDGALNTLAYSEGRLIACVGTEDLIVVETPDAILVAKHSSVQNVKAIVARIKNEKGTEANFHRKVYRPWGYYDSIDEGKGFHVKRIVVNPGARLSLQMHHHRSEHWIVVRGTARVTRGDESFLLSENESTYIALGQTHRLENPGKLPLEMIEVQSGTYLGEDDIVRFDDHYGRS
ncbi:mannose-1-phosphate guanylyltransferase/mannose-6-phosphate isomerase [Paraburkholderia panacisoli]|uniref:mannose-1-phosphate guanylyltransferase n=1 Tax=Paraburkholderia panacisoli TaxID=2603818 RepID=A0A5B0GGQ4_9BURK|nr:mannose-1-phosphate guanylyltransferase/mannose-6-phosphate isomerase [Paraburkholderia panacisoli]KAA1002563.1 mannose-1-phosphate guanylyltransferase/mannose-6-phosphate isomerase [Paraburkholderia panacisoli]